jgi:hypothetical protein
VLTRTLTFFGFGCGFADCSSKGLGINLQPTNSLTALQGSPLYDLLLLLSLPTELSLCNACLFFNALILTRNISLTLNIIKE